MVLFATEKSSKLSKEQFRNNEAIKQFSTISLQGQQLISAKRLLFNATQSFLIMNTELNAQAILNKSKKSKSVKPVLATKYR
jgi:hypothetical protein